MLEFVFLVILSPFVVLLLRWYYKINRFEKYLKTIPGPALLPILGSGSEFASTTSFLPKIMEYYKKYKSNYKIYFGTQPFLFVFDDKDLEFILSSTTLITKSRNYKFLQNWLGTGLLTSGGNKWRKHRKIITPAFHFQILEEFIDIFNSSSDILVTKLDAESKRGTIDIYPFIARCTLDIICETAMGTSVNAQNDLDSEYVKCVNNLLAVIKERIVSPILANDFLYYFSKAHQRERNALKVVHGYTKLVINKRKEQFLNDSKNHDEAVDHFGRKKKRAFLDLLLEYSLKDPSFTEEDIQQEVDTFMFEGHDTTATTITFALFALATNPEVQKKAYEELQEIFSDDPKRSATYRDLNEMKYLEMVLKETLRIYTTVPVYSRGLEEDVDMNGILLPKGLIVTVCAYGVQKNPDIFNNPGTFDPERFTAESARARSPFSYVPFSAGPRNCIGQKFAMLEMKSTISDVLRNFELFSAVPEHKIVLKSDAVLKSDNGVFIQLKRRI